MFEAGSSTPQVVRSRCRTQDSIAALMLTRRGVSTTPDEEKKQAGMAVWAATAWAADITDSSYSLPPHPFRGRWPEAAGRWTSECM